MAPAKQQEKEERKLTLPIGHPSAGYVSPDLSGMDGVGTLPDEEQEIHDERNDAREDEIKAVEENEHKVATEEAKAREEAEKKVADAEKQKLSAASTSTAKS